jgi:hypothetical protein
MGKQLGDLAVWNALVAECGSVRAAGVLGWAFAAWAMGVAATERDLLTHGPGSRATRYRYVGWLRAAAARLRAEGYDVAPDDPAVRAVLDALA